MNHADVNLKRLLSNVYGVRLKSKRHFKKYCKKFYSNSLTEPIVKMHIERHWRFSKRIKNEQAPVQPCFY